MRRLLIAAACGLVLGVAGAAGNDDNAPEARAYFGLSFGGAKTVPHDLHYGLRIDQDSRLFAERPAAPLMQFDFTRHGLNEARLNGLPVLKRSYQLRQNDAGGEAPAEETVVDESAPADATEAEPAAESAPAETADASMEEPVEAAEEQGFFGRVGSWFGGLFGADEAEEEVVEDDSAPADAEEEELAEGTFMGFDAVDWTVLAAGVVGLGYVASEVTNGDDDNANTSTPGEGEGDCTVLVDPLCAPGGGGTLLPGGTLIPTLRGDAFLPTAANRDPAYQEWLDGGSGHMGDLGVAQ